MSTTPVHLMSQYYPSYNSKNDDFLRRRLSEKEINEIIAYAKDKNILLY